MCCIVSLSIALQVKSRAVLVTLKVDFLRCLLLNLCHWLRLEEPQLWIPVDCSLHGSSEVLGGCDGQTKDLLRNAQLHHMSNSRGLHPPDHVLVRGCPRLVASMVVSAARGTASCGLSLFALNQIRRSLGALGPPWIHRWIRHRTLAPSKVSKHCMS